MSRFFDRYLPRNERRTALWLALGGAAVSVLGSELNARLQQAVRLQVDPSGAPAWTPAAIAALTEFAIIALVVAALVRFGRAPKALALYLVLGSAVAVFVQIVGLPVAYLGARIGTAIEGVRAPGIMAGWWVPSLRGALEDLSFGLGALAGAWIATTVSLARIRDAGFSGDDPEGEGLRSKPAGIGWSFLGWHGKPAVGESLIAIAFVQLELVVGIVMLVYRFALVFFPTRYETTALAAVSGTVSAVVLALAWVYAARLVTKRTGVVSLWVLAAAGFAESAWWVVENLGRMDLGGMSGADWLAILSTVGISAFLIAATLAGTELALRARPATLSPDGPQDSEAPDAPLDTAGDER